MAKLSLWEWYLGKNPGNLCSFLWARGLRRYVLVSIVFCSAGVRSGCVLYVWASGSRTLVCYYLSFWPFLGALFLFVVLFSGFRCFYYFVFCTYGISFFLWLLGYLLCLSCWFYGRFFFSLYVFHLLLLIYFPFKKKVAKKWG